ncbi:MAG: hypothetical protein JO353_08245 [Phycisphaerae bacterium]|nr:hypothetical protein [Phycisphaerae bacterium]
MSTDIRLPMGLMFTILGVILTFYGAVTSHSPALAQSLGINVDLWWGMVILLFGLSMLGLAWRSKRKAPLEAPLSVPK